MSDAEIQRNLAQLRAEVAALSSARRESDSASAGAEATPQPSEAPAAAPASGGTVEGGGEEAEQSQLDELLELLEAEIKDLPTITCLIVFSLGILMGRFLR